MSRLDPGPFTGLPDGVVVTCELTRNVRSSGLDSHVLYVVVSVDGEETTLRVEMETGRSPGERIAELGAELRRAFAPPPVSFTGGPMMDRRFSDLGKRPRQHRARSL